MRAEILLLLSALLQFVSSTGRRVLDDYVIHYEPLHYEREDVHDKHQRVRRSIDPMLHLHFKAYQKTFNLRLQPDRTIFMPDHVMEYDGKTENVDTSFIYSGHVAGVPNSHVHGAVINGTFRGEIHIPDSPIYHIEPSDRYFIKWQPFPSVIYSEEDLVLDPYRHRREADRSVGAQCGLEDSLSWMDRIANSAIPGSHRDKRSENANEHSKKYSREANQRSRRSTTDGRIGRQEINTCTLFLRSDPMLMQYMLETLRYDETRAKDEILALFASHVEAIKRIYSDTRFETSPGSPGQPMWYKGITFSLQRTAVMTKQSENCDGQVSRKSVGMFCGPNIDVSNFLNLNSQKDHNDYCLAYVFTYRDFSKGTLGLAWVGSPSNAKGGICERWDRYPEGNKEVWKSLNTGVITLINYGKRVPPKVSQLTFAHEVGHNFGSPHDSGTLCTPYGKNTAGANEGNYIMFASATSGDRKHNSEFSPCSKDNITRVLNAVFNGFNKKENCFKRSGEAFCGNSIVETGEECDCGYKEDCQENCCYHRGSSNEKQCRLMKDINSGIVCSPSQGPCCNTSCQFVPASANQMCKAQVECAERANCNGSVASCPEPSKTPDMEFCQGKSLVCIDGVCQGSVCKKIGWDECFIGQSPDDANYREKQCYLACFNNATTTCISSNDDQVSQISEYEALLMNISNSNALEAIQLPAGSPCNNFEGYCDVFHKCRGVDAEGPLARLKNLIFNPQTLQTVREWIQEHWWAVLLMCIGLVLFMAAFIKFCAVHTPSSNPRKAPARKLTQTFSTLRRGGRPYQQPRQSAPAGPPPPYEYPGHPAGGPPHGRGQRQGQKQQARGKGHRGQDLEMAAKV